MNLSPREKDKLLVAMAAMVARNRLARGVRLNHPEAIALIALFNLGRYLPVAASALPVNDYQIQAWLARNQERAAAKKKAAEDAAAAAAPQPSLHVTDHGQRIPLDQARLEALITAACHDLNADISPAPIVAETLRNQIGRAHV